MARLVQLGTLIDDLRAELQDSTQSALGQTNRDILTRHLQATQSYLWLKYSWPFLKVREDLDLSAGLQYYTLPSNIAPESVYEVRQKWSSIWSDPLDRGIGADQYNSLDSDDDTRADPVQRWDLVSVSNVVQLEVWPLPATNQTDALRVTGKRSLRAFVSDSDTCDLDSELLVKWTAGRILKRRQAAEANFVQAEANEILTSLRVNLTKSGNRYTFAQAPDVAPERVLRVVPVSS